MEGLNGEGNLIGALKVSVIKSCVSGESMLLTSSIQRPRIFLAPGVESQIWEVVVNTPGEVGWLGSVLRRGPELVIDGIYCFQQVADESFNSLDADALRLFWRRKALAGEEELLGRMMFWGHSHGKYPVCPSPTDRHTMQQVFRGQGFPLVIMGIFNHHYESWFSVYDYDNGLIFDDVGLQV